MTSKHKRFSVFFFPAFFVPFQGKSDSMQASVNGYKTDFCLGEIKYRALTVEC